MARTLVIQMGHAGRTTGATGAPGEQAYTQAVGAECARLLNRDGWSVRLIVADPPTAQYRGDAFFAIHADGSTSPRVRGASIGYQNSAGNRLAHAWQSAYTARGFTGPWHPDNYTANLAQYYGVRTAVSVGTLAACIIECGTITNDADRALMLPSRVALAIGDALGIVQPAPASKAAEPPKPTRESGNMVITCTDTKPTRCALLSGGVLLDISDDTNARGFAQDAINRNVVAEIRVTEATWDRLAGTSK